ncbi:MAG: hypothetical protein MJ175_00160 [Clostridia bacterium]|nr:hypothetical protein [Clostridia bacterium]
MNKTFKSIGKHSVPHWLAGNTDLSALYKAGAVLCYTFFICHYPCYISLTAFQASPHHLSILLFFILCTLCGYALQWLTGRIFRIRRQKTDAGYEDSVKHRYKPLQAIPVHIAAVFVYQFAHSLGFSLLKQYAEIYTRDSAEPVLLGLCAAAMIEAGAFFWFMPYEVLISQRSIKIAAFLIFAQIFINFFGGALNVGPFPVTEVIALFFAVLLFLLILNQENLTREYENRVSYVNDASKLYSTGVIVLAVSLIMCVVTTINEIVRVVFLLLEFVLGYALINFDGEGYQVEDCVGGESGQISQIMKSDAHTGNWVILVLAILFLGIFLYMISPSLREKFREFWKMLLDELAGFFGHKYEKAEKETTESPFDDQYENLIRKKDAGSPLPSLKAYQKHCQTLPDDRARYEYAYAVYAQYMEQHCETVESSDTPRQRAGKVKGDTRFSPRTEPVTASFELIRYRESNDAELPMLSDHLAELQEFLNRVL